MTKCEICGLKAGRESDQKRTLMAKLPTDEERCKQWVKAIGKEDLAYVPIEKLCTLKHVCAKHFRPKDFNKKKTRLKKRAIPSVALTAKPLLDEQLIEFPLHVITKKGTAKSQTVHLEPGDTCPQKIDHTYSSHVDVNRNENGEEVATIRKIVPIDVSDFANCTSQRSKAHVSSNLLDHTYSCQSDGNKKENGEEEAPAIRKVKPIDVSTFVVFKGSNGVEVKWKQNPKIASESQNTTDTAADNIKSDDDMAISPLPSPCLEDSPTPHIFVPNTGANFKGQIGVELTPSANSNKLSDTEGHVSGVFSHVTIPGPRVVSPELYCTKAKPVYLGPTKRKLSYCCKSVYDKLNAAITTLKKANRYSSTSALRKARKKSFEFITNRMPLIVRTFVRMQANMINKKPRAYRFLEDEKLLCLSLYMANSAAYKFMSAIFKLPSMRTLNYFGLNPKDRPPKSDATNTSQEGATPAHTPNTDMPIVDAAEVSSAVAAITPAAPAPATPAPSAVPPAPLAVAAAANPAHAELIAELKKCLPTPPKLPAAGTRLTDDRGRFVRRLEQPRAKTTSARVKTGPPRAKTGPPRAKTGPPRAKKPFALRDTTIKVFKLAPETTCEDVATHVSAIVPHYLVRCRKILTKVKGPGFILEVPLQYKESVLDPSFWPEGVITWAWGSSVPFLDTMLKMRVYNVAEGTPVSDMVKHICQAVPENKMTCEKVDSIGRGETFRISMPRSYLKVVSASSFWPAGVRVARIRNQLNPRKKRMKRANTTDLDLEEHPASKKMSFGGKFRPSAYRNS